MGIYGWLGITDISSVIATFPPTHLIESSEVNAELQRPTTRFASKQIEGKTTFI